MKIIVKKPNEEMEIVETNEKYFGECVKSILGQDVLVERVYCNDSRFIMGVNEKGLLLQLPLNFWMETSSNLFPVQSIVGDVVFARCKPNDPFKEIYDDEVIDVTDDDVKLVRELIEPSKQIEVFEKYCEWLDEVENKEEEMSL